MKPPKPPEKKKLEDEAAKNYKKVGMEKKESGELIGSGYDDFFHDAEKEQNPGAKKLKLVAEQKVVQQLSKDVKENPAEYDFPEGKSGEVVLMELDNLVKAFEPKIAEQGKLEKDVEELANQQLNPSQQVKKAGDGGCYLDFVNMGQGDCTRAPRGRVLPMEEDSIRIIVDWSGS